MDPSRSTALAFQDYKLCLEEELEFPKKPLIMTAIGTAFNLRPAIITLLAARHVCFNQRESHSKSL
jgi:hypothetical protein